MQQERSTDCVNALVLRDLVIFLCKICALYHASNPPMSCFCAKLFSAVPVCCPSYAHGHYKVLPHLLMLFRMQDCGSRFSVFGKKKQKKKKRLKNYLREDMFPSSAHLADLNVIMAACGSSPPPPPGESLSCAGFLPTGGSTIPSCPIPSPVDVPYWCRPAPATKISSCADIYSKLSGVERC